VRRQPIKSLSGFITGLGRGMRLLRDAMAKGRVLRVGFASLDSDIIEEVQELKSGISKRDG